MINKFLFVYSWIKSLRSNQLNRHISLELHVVKTYIKRITSIRPLCKFSILCPPNNLFLLIKYLINKIIIDKTTGSTVLISFRYSDVESSKVSGDLVMSGGH
jgi:hypothetical protein